MLKLKNEEPESQLAILKDKIDQLKNKIPQIKHFETGKNLSQSPSAFDLALVSEFENLDELEQYRIHPEHQEVLKFVKEVTQELAVVDYEF